MANERPPFKNLINVHCATDSLTLSHRLELSHTVLAMYEIETPNTAALRLAKKETTAKGVIYNYQENPIRDLAVVL